MNIFSHVNKTLNKKQGNTSLIVVISALVFLAGLVGVVSLKKQQMKPAREAQQFPIGGGDEYIAYFEIEEGPDYGSVSANDTVVLHFDLTTTGEAFDQASLVYHYDTSEFQYVSDTIDFPTDGDEMKLKGECGYVSTGSSVMERYATIFTNIGGTPMQIARSSAVRHTTLTLKALVDNPTSVVRIAALTDNTQCSDSLFLHFDDKADPGENSILQQYADQTKLSISFSTGPVTSPSPSPSSPPSSDCETYNLDGDEKIDLGDLLEVIQNWQQGEHHDYQALIYILTHWGLVCI